MPIVLPNSPSPRAVVRAGIGTAVALGASTAVLLFAVLTLGTTWLARRAPAPSRDSTAFAVVSPEVDLWVGDLAPGVKGVLSSAWDDPVWDGKQDLEWHRGLHLKEQESIAFYQLVAFNTSDTAATLQFGAGALAIRMKDGAAVSVLRSIDLGALLARPDVSGGASAGTLRTLGADRAAVELPPGRMIRRPIAFERRVSLADADAVSRADGDAFHRRRMRRGEWAGLLHNPSIDQIRGL